jgi:Uma2 family endonuclease
MSTIAKTTTSRAAGGRMTVDEFERFTENLDEPFELIEGLMVAKVTKKPPHVIATENVRDELLGLFSRPKWRVSTESPVRIPDYNEPEPDVMLIRGSKKTYVGRTPGPADLALVVEVSYYSLVKDRKRIAIYGNAGIPVYWIVNVNDQKVEVYTLKTARRLWQGSHLQTRPVRPRRHRRCSCRLYRSRRYLATRSGGRRQLTAVSHGGDGA